MCAVGLEGNGAVCTGLFWSGEVHVEVEKGNAEKILDDMRRLDQRLGCVGHEI